MLGLHCHPGFSLVAEKGDYSLVVEQGLLMAVAFPVAAHRLQDWWAQ